MPQQEAENTIGPLVPGRQDVATPNVDSVCGDVDGCAPLDEHGGIADGKPKSGIGQKAKQEIEEAALETAEELLREMALHQEVKDFYDDVLGEAA